MPMSASSPAAAAGKRKRAKPNSRAAAEGQRKRAKPNWLDHVELEPARRLVKKRSVKVISTQNPYSILYFKLTQMFCQARQGGNATPIKKKASAARAAGGTVGQIRYYISVYILDGLIWKLRSTLNMLPLKYRCPVYFY